VSTAARGRLERRYFEDLYERDGDPWRFATSDYERDKYTRTLAALGDRRFTRALEVGCSIGVFTELLAARCEVVEAVDVSDRAVRAARERTTGLDGVTVERRELPEETPEGPFDLIVCSEVLYYWTAEVLERGLDALTQRLLPKGLLLAVHWTDPTDTYPLQGGEAHRLLRGHRGLTPVTGESHERYRLDLMERA
jgi:predicted TPR repeat methyltransferase